MKLNLLFTLTVLLLSSACSTGNKSFIVSPELYDISKNKYFHNAINFNMLDKRLNHHVVEITQEDKPATLINSNNALSNVIEKAVSPAFLKQGLIINESSHVKLTIIIDKALVQVQQYLVNYKVKNTLDFTVEVSSAQKKLTKKFSSSLSSKGPLKADLAVLERDFNNQLASLLTKIIHNVEIQKTIKAQNIGINKS